MADFNADGFSAVAAFFGEDGKSDGSAKKPTTKSQVPVAKSSSGGRKHFRLGLGATPETSKQSQVGLLGSAAKDIGKKILRVGRSKKGQHAHDEDEILDHEQEDRNDDDEGDEEEGRTSVVKSKIKKRAFDAAAIIADAAAQKGPKKKKKKKAGKKERGMAAEAKAAAEEKASEEAAETSSKDQIEDDAAGEPSLTTLDGGGDAKKTERKRKKIRSRQKNIRKDTRPARLKPAHLVLGNGQYCGRALTPETRAAMNLPESKTRQKAKRLLQEGGEDGHASDHSHGGASSSGAGSGGAFIELGLAVDDMFNDVGVAADGSGPKSNGVKAKKHKKKKKKSKFKNLK